jgi:hypothetical protein
VSYGIGYTDEAVESLGTIVDERIPAEHHEAVYDIIIEQLVELAAHPIGQLFVDSERRNVAVISFEIGGQHFYWGVRVQYSQDEKDIILTQFGPLTFMI